LAFAGVACRPGTPGANPPPAVADPPAAAPEVVVEPPHAVEPDTAALDEACATVLRDSQALLAEAKAQFEASLPDTVTLDEAPFAGLGQCQRGPGGAWVLAVLDMGVDIDDTLPSWHFEGAVQLTFIANDGTVLPYEEAVLLSVGNNPDAFDELHVSLLSVHDYDDDGVVEAVTDEHSSGYDLDAHAFEIWTRAEADGDVFVTPWAFHEPGFDIDIVKDLDGDGVYDVIDEHRWRAGECFGMSGTPDFGNPPIAFHAANGGFSSDDEVAAEFLRAQCPRAPERLLIGGDYEWELAAKHAIACARAWGRTADDVIAQVRREWNGLQPDDVDGERSCGTPRAEFEAYARIEPPLQLQ